VDILSMSFGFPSKAGLTAIQDTLQLAHSKGMLILAAAANHGGNKKIAYPASQHHMVIGVHSMTGNGKPSDFTPYAQDLSENFGALGEAVESAWPRHLLASDKRDKCTRRKSGTSFATPIAAGIAATMLHYARLTFRDDGEILEELKRSEPKRALLRLVANQNGNYRYIDPTSFFEKNKDLITASMRDAILE
jgi:hypothetical protein